MWNRELQYVCVCRCECQTSRDVILKPHLQFHKTTLANVCSDKWNTCLSFASKQFRAVQCMKLNSIPWIIGFHFAVWNEEMELSTPIINQTKRGLLQSDSFKSKLGERKTLNYVIIMRHKQHQPHMRVCSNFLPKTQRDYPLQWNGNGCSNSFKQLAFSGKGSFYNSVKSLKSGWMDEHKKCLIWTLM